MQLCTVCVYVCVHIYIYTYIYMCVFHISCNNVEQFSVNNLVEGYAGIDYLYILDISSTGTPFRAGWGLFWAYVGALPVKTGAKAVFYARDSMKAWFRNGGHQGVRLCDHRL